MNPEFVTLLLCPDCGKGDIRESNSDQLQLRCAECEAAFPIRDDVPRFVDEESYSSSFGYQWNQHRRTQLDSHTGLPVSRTRLFEATGWPDNLKGQLILEAGCGAGRFTEVLLTTGAKVYSFDYSSAVDANRANNGNNGNLCLFQADIFHVPLKDAIFDKVLCLGVLQHTPDPAKAFRSISRLVRSGGQVTVDVYASRLRSLLHWKYLLRPVTRRMPNERLYAITERVVSKLLPATTWLRRTTGRAGARLMPIIEYSHLGLPAELNRQWAILDTFDMYSPAHDHPQSIYTVRRWFEQAGFADITVRYGPNGIVGKGRRE